MNKLKPYNIKYLFAYLRNKLSNAERYELDKDISKDPFLSDAMDGFAQLSMDELEQDIQDLNTALNSKTKSTKVKSIAPYLKFAAGIALLIGIGSVLIFKSVNELNNKQIAESPLLKKEQNEINRPYISPEKARKLLDDLNIEQSSPPELENHDAKKQITLDIAPTQGIERKNKIVPIKETSNETFEDELVIELTEAEFMVADAEIMTMEVDEEEEESSDKNNATFFKSKKASPSVIAEREKDMLPKDSPNQILKESLNGLVIDGDTKEPIIGANIFQNNKGTVSDINGKFSIEIDNDSLIKVAFIGYQTQEIHINELSEGTIKIELHSDQLALQEVVVKGVSRSNSRMTTGSVSRIEPNKFPPENLSHTVRAKNIRINYNSGYEKHAIPNTGIKEFSKYIEQNSTLKPEKSKKVIVEFYVSENGSIGPIKTIKTDGVEFTNEATRLINNGPKWTPAKNNGYKVQELVNLKIVFKK